QVLARGGVIVGQVGRGGAGQEGLVGAHGGDCHTCAVRTSVFGTVSCRRVSDRHMVMSPARRRTDPVTTDRRPRAAEPMGPNSSAVRRGNCHTGAPEGDKDGRTGLPASGAEAVNFAFHPVRSTNSR